MKRFLFIPLLMSLLSSCNSGEDLIIPESNTASQLKTYSIEEILSRAENYYQMLPGQEGAKTRSSHPVVKNIYSLSKGTRSEDANAPVYYLVNYENEEGFAIVGGNSNSRPLLAISDESNLTSEDIEAIPGVNDFVTYSITLPTQPIDTLTPKPTEPLNISIAPKIHYKVRQWGQGTPFNSYTPMIDGQHTVTGCVPLATAILMSYYECPKSHKEITIDWKTIKQSYYTDGLGQLIAELGEEGNLDVEYGLTASNSYTSLVPRTMMSHGYTPTYHQISLQSIEIYPTQESKNELNQKLPFITRGEGYFKITNSKAGGHAWIIDGLLHIPSDPDNILNPNPDPDAYFLHCVWGWYGKANGYYLYDGLGTFGGDRYSKNPNDYTYPGMEDKDNPYIFKERFYGYYGFIPSPTEVEIVGPFKP